MNDTLAFHTLTQVWLAPLSTYRRASQINHWLGALIILPLLGSGLWIRELPPGDEHLYWLRMHIALSVISLPIIAFRVWWSLTTPAPRPMPQEPLLQRTARLIHGLLLSTVAILALSGPWIIWSQGTSIEVFDWFAIPSPVGPSPRLNEILSEIHLFAADVFTLALGLHILGTIKHLLTNPKLILRRMFGIDLTKSVQLSERDRVFSHRPGQG